MKVLLQFHKCPLLNSHIDELQAGNREEYRGPAGTGQSYFFEGRYFGQLAERSKEVLAQNLVPQYQVQRKMTYL
jgi:hypothetical protein